jgi:hypothetical protein
MTIWLTERVLLHLHQLRRAVQLASREAMLGRFPDRGSVFGDERVYGISQKFRHLNSRVILRLRPRFFKVITNIMRLEVANFERWRPNSCYLYSFI